MPIPPDDRTRLIKLLGMTGSAHDAEALTALRFAGKILVEHKATWAEVFSTPGSDRYQDGYSDGYRRGLAEGAARGRPKPLTWRALAKELLESYEDDLTPWELQFVTGFLSRGYPSPTPKQGAIFQRICERVDIEMPMRDL